MGFFLTFLVWCVLFVVCWPLALLAFIAYPLVWLIALPFRLCGAAVSGLLAFIKAVFLLPACLLGWRPAS